MGNEIVLDIEADGFIFESTKIWTISVADKTQGDKIRLNPFKDTKAKDKFLKYIFRTECPRIIFHNGLGYDMFVLMNLLGISFSVGKDTIEGKPVEFVDTYYLSMFLNPDRPAHSVEYFGTVLGLPKIDWRERAIQLGLIERAAPDGAEFQQHHEEMDVYCDRDVAVSTKIYDYLLKEWKETYNKSFSHTQAFKCGQKSFYLMSCQELTGWKFDIKKARKLEIQITQMMEEIRGEVEPELPPRKLKKSEEAFYTMPAKPFKMNGDYSTSWEKFVEKHSGEEVDDGWKFHGAIYQVEAKKMLDVKLPMEMSNQEQMKDWFLSSGWKPTFYNYQKDASGKPLRIDGKLIQTSPKIQDAGKICPNLLTMEGVIVKKVVKWLSLRNRLAVLEGWLGNKRLLMDGRLGAGRTGIASSHRQKHRVIVNVPKASEKVLLGPEFRSLFTSEDGMVIAAGDAAALEGRVQGSYCHKYDGGETARELLNGDPHSKNAIAFYWEDEPIIRQFDINSPDFDKEDKVFKPFRDRSKNGLYATLYGCSAAKLASTLGLPESRGKILLDKFWQVNPGTKALKDAVEKYWALNGQSKYLPSIDGRVLVTRKKSALLNTLFQSCGGIAMDYACCFLDTWLGPMQWKDRKPYYLYKGYVVRRIGYFHDEVEFECEEEIAEEVAALIEKAIKKAGEYLKMKIELEGEGKVGKNWRDVH